MTAFDADGLPDVVLLQIFRLLKFSDLCKVGRVCRRWYGLSRSQALWTCVDASAPEISSVQMDRLASVLTDSVRWLYVSSFLHCGLFLSPGALRDLRAHCPYLSTLVIKSALLTTLDDFAPVTVGDLPPTLKTLSLRHSFFQVDQFFSLLAIRNLSILDLSFCWCVSDQDIPFVTQLPNLRELYLEYCEDIRDTGVALVEGVSETPMKISDEISIKIQSSQICHNPHPCFKSSILPKHPPKSPDQATSKGSSKLIHM
ncbi:hypothetical protein HPB52_023533 [Rhipicephalus sanguineus]|uniref:F-box domain-containing protein n=1 Tax=Rhipicephalus sanguineus TaxID=34632 RepID=A0A9D4YR50_RHISA|nr:hypothetical protein HPB52_023533 [Rhipicephalus sanguineus]